jgi:hypothetical protein
MTNIITEQENLIYGDSSDIITTMINSLVTMFQSEFKGITKPINAENRNDLANEWVITLLIELINKNTLKLEKTFIFTFGEDILSQVYE